MVNLEKLATRYAFYLDGIYGSYRMDEAFDLACAVDSRCLLYTGQQYWKYVLPRFINFDWREELKVWRTQPI